MPGGADGGEGCFHARAGPAGPAPAASCCSLEPQPDPCLSPSDPLPSLCPKMYGLKSHFMKLLVGQFDGVEQSIILSDNQLDNYHTLPLSSLLFFFIF